MNCIILAGVPRSGKSILANRLCSQSHLSRIPIDSFITTFEELKPSCGISVNNFGRTCRILRPFLFGIVDQLQYEFMDAVIDGYYILPKWFVNDLSYKVYFLGILLLSLS